MNIPYAFKKCSKCGEWKIANNYNFYKDKSRKWGLKSRCKKCDKEYSREYRKSENGKKNQAKADNKYNNSEKGKKKRIEYRKSEEGKKIRAKAQSKYSKTDKGKLTQEKYHDSEKYKSIMFNQNSKRRFKEDTQGDGITQEQWFECFEFFNWECAYSGIQLTKENRNLDHVIALNNGGEHEIWNCVPMYDKYNISKHANDMLEWYLEQEYFDIDRLTKIYEWRIYAYWKWGK